MEVIRESIFSSAIRAFFRGAFGVLGFFIIFIPAFLLFSSLGGEKEYQRKTVTEILPDLDGKVASTIPTTPVVLQINIDGVIGYEHLNGDTVRHQLIESQMGKLQGRIKAILLHMNTPGGTVNDADTIFRLLLAYKEKYQVPIYAFVEGLCASGGMYVSCAANKIYANPASLTGSIGVILGPFFNVSETLEKVGIATKTLIEGKGKNAMSPFHPWKEGEEKEYQDIIAYYYNQFTNLVSKYRHIQKEKLVNDYGAKVFTPIEAKKIGYIDAVVPSYNEALKALLDEAKIDTQKPYQVISLKPKRRWLDDLFQGKSPLTSGKITHQVSMGKQSLHTHYPVSYLYDPQK